VLTGDLCHNRRMPSLLDIDAILAQDPAPTARHRLDLGPSRAGRRIAGYRLGTGPLRASLIAGCHADEPVGPLMLARLVTWLEGLPAGHSPLRRIAWHLVPDANPDGAAANAAWSGDTVPASAPGGRPGRGYDLGRYLANVVREAPGEDVEFGFPRHPNDHQARPETRAIAAFLRPLAPLHLHASFHGMAFAAGPWFLLEPSWAQRTCRLRRHVRAAVRALGYTMHDVDRRGEKGFVRIDRGFTTRPNAAAMAAHFEARGDPRTAALFRPSSMDFVRALGGDPLTLVSEMPLFSVPAHLYQQTPVRPPALQALRNAAAKGDPSLSEQAQHLGIQPMPLADQMRLQLIYLNAALAAVENDMSAS